MLDKYPKKVKLVTKNFPLSSIHPFAYKAAIAALAADAQGKFWEFHNKLFENFRGLNDATIHEIASELKLDMDRFNKSMQDSSIKKVIDRDIREGKQIGFKSIPAIFVNGKLTSPRELENLIDAELKKKKSR